MPLIIIRRVVGDSMLPALRPAQLVVATRHFGPIRPRQVVIITHHGVEKVKRVERVDDERREIFVAGDNAEHSTDSRHFGWLPNSAVLGVVRWPHI